MTEENKNSNGKNTDPDENKNPNQERQRKPADKKQSELVDYYKKHYPNEKTFHVTSDYQVFLGKDLAPARMHQKKADATKEVQTVKV